MTKHTFRLVPLNGDGGKGERALYVTLY